MKGWPGRCCYTRTWPGGRPGSVSSGTAPQRIEFLTEELYAKYKEEVPGFEDVKDDEGYPVFYNRVWQYVESGGEIPSYEWEQNGREDLRAFYEKLQEIDNREDPEEA